MTTDLRALAATIRGVPPRVAAVISGADDDAVRRRPAPGEWSAIEVAGHLCDKFHHWRLRTERVAGEDGASLEPYDQDRAVEEAGYAEARLADVLRTLEERSEAFARTVESLPLESLANAGSHPEYDTVPLLSCVTMPLDSIEEHLEQMRAALAG